MITSSPQLRIITLEGLVLPKTSQLKRKHVRPEKRWTDHYLDKYDQHTLMYDCFYQPDSQRYIVTAPRFLNLWPLLSKHLYINGKKYRGLLRRTTWQRCEQVSIAAPKNATLEIRAADYTSVIPIRQTAQADFNQLNVMLAINKNNPLSWIHDWVKFHVNEQNLEGVCIIDNASTDYSSRDILDTLAGIKGLKSATVLVAPFPYGPVNRSKKLEISPRFLQTSMFNVIKRDLFNKARAVLSIDIDELVIKNTAVNVFDAAVNAKLGAVSFREIRTFPNSQNESAHPQRDHTMIKEDFKFGNTKWCVSGKGFMNKFGWAVHRFGGGFFPLTETKKFNYLHCQTTTTNWKKNRLAIQSGLIESEKIRQKIEKNLLSSD